jgi:dihydroxyacetone kinase-like predicted kinase
MVAFDGSRTAAENAKEMREAIESVATGEVTIASRDVQMNGIPITKGEWLGLSEGEPVSGGADFDDVTYAVVERLLSEPRELLTLLVGRDGAKLSGVLDRIAEEHPEVEVDVQEGGQPHYHLLLSAE